MPKKGTQSGFEQNRPKSLELCKKLSCKVEAFKLGKFRGSIWMSLGETSRSEVFYLDRPSSIWKGGLDLNQGLLLDESGGSPR